MNNSGRGGFSAILALGACLASANAMAGAVVFSPINFGVELTSLTLTSDLTMPLATGYQDVDSSVTISESSTETSMVTGSIAQDSVDPNLVHVSLGMTLFPVLTFEDTDSSFDYVTGSPLEIVPPAPIVLTDVYDVNLSTSAVTENFTMTGGKFVVPLNADVNQNAENDMLKIEFSTPTSLSDVTDILTLDLTGTGCDLFANPSTCLAGVSGSATLSFTGYVGDNLTDPPINDGLIVTAMGPIGLGSPLSVPEPTTLALAGLGLLGLAFWRPGRRAQRRLAV